MLREVCGHAPAGRLATRIISTEEYARAGVNTPIGMQVGCSGTFSGALAHRRVAWLAVWHERGSRVCFDQSIIDHVFRNDRTLLPTH